MPYAIQKLNKSEIIINKDKYTKNDKKRSKVIKMKSKKKAEGN